MDKKSFYITTPIYYPSAKLHIGHAYCTTIADSVARFHRLADEEVFFLTGSDEHGQKIQQKAEEQGITPIEYVNPIVAGFQNLWKLLNISNDDFIRTTEKRHEKVVQEVFRRIYAKGDIYKGAFTVLHVKAIGLSISWMKMAAVQIVTVLYRRFLRRHISSKSVSMPIVS